MDEVKKKSRIVKRKTKSAGNSSDEEYEQKKIANKEFKKNKKENIEDQEDWEYWQEYYK